jgi:hypothetical protein
MCVCVSTFSLSSIKTAIRLEISIEFQTQLSFANSMPVFGLCLWRHFRLPHFGR